MNNKNNNNQTQTQTKKIELRLGDILSFTDTGSPPYYFVDYLDSSQTFLVALDLDQEENHVGRQRMSLKEGRLYDALGKKIKKLSILSRAEFPGYARQNGLLPGQWIDVHFGGDLPMILTGKIVGLEEDMIEVQGIDGDTFYLNFQYQGLPEDLHIDEIVLREAPVQPVEDKEVEDKEVEDKEVEDKEIEDKEGEDKEGEEEKDEDEDKEEKDEDEDKEEKDEDKEVEDKDEDKEVEDKDEASLSIQFGEEELGSIRNYVPLNEKKQRYSLEIQVMDLLNSLLAPYPPDRRTPWLLQRMTKQVERFRQLREQFSVKDMYGQIIGPLSADIHEKPLTTCWPSTPLLWLKPVIEQRKKVYVEVDGEEEGEGEQESSSDSSIIKIDRQQDLENIRDVISMYEANRLSDDKNKYLSLQKALEPSFLPYESSSSSSSSSSSKEQRLGQARDVFWNEGSLRMLAGETIPVKEFACYPKSVMELSRSRLPGSSFLQCIEYSDAEIRYGLPPKPTVYSSDMSMEHSGILKVVGGEGEEREGEAREGKYPSTTKLIRDFMEEGGSSSSSVSLGRLIAKLEPFCVYEQNIHRAEFSALIQLVKIRIQEAHHTMKSRKELFAMLKSSSSSSSSSGEESGKRIESLLKKTMQADVFPAYKMEGSSSISSADECLKEMWLLDGGRVFSLALCLQNESLVVPFDMEPFLSKEFHESSSAAGICAPKVIAKYYSSLDSMQRDDNRGGALYFDKRYDKTNYSLLSNYEKEVLRMSTEDLKVHMRDDLKKKLQLSTEEAITLTETLIHGHKEVREGHYAIVYKGQNMTGQSTLEMYQRKNNKWVLSSAEVLSDDPAALCNLNKKCVTSKPSKADGAMGCQTTQHQNYSVQTALYQQILQEFDARYTQSKEDFKTRVQADFTRHLAALEKRVILREKRRIKYNQQKAHLALSDDVEEEVVSPYAGVLKMILREPDIAKRQADLVRMVGAFLIQPPPPHSSHWLLCKKTGVPLLPVFRFQWASVYVSRGPAAANEFMETLKTSIGRKSDDGDMIVDKHTGWTLCSIDLSTDEGYEDNGFKRKTRGLFDEDAGVLYMKSAASASASANSSITYLNPETRMIASVLTTLAQAMSVNIDEHKEFIINLVSHALKQTMDTEQEHRAAQEERAKRGKTTTVYKEVVQKALLYYTFGAFWIACQTAIPSIKSRRTHPGCVQSFQGFPLEPGGDDSGLTYLSCVSKKLRTVSEPWKYLAKSKDDEKEDKNKAYIQSSIESVLLKITECKTRMEDKIRYLATLAASAEESEVLEEHRGWPGFLPPLTSASTVDDNYRPLNDSFKDSLSSSIRNGLKTQLDQLGGLRSKQRALSFHVQHLIAKVVKESKSLFPGTYLENACCSSTSASLEPSLEYFEKKEPQIRALCTQIARQETFLEDIISYSKGKIVCSSVNTKNHYPAITTEVEPSTIALTFAQMCRFKSAVLPIPEEFKAVCGKKLDPGLLGPLDTPERVVQVMKQAGRNYTLHDFQTLLQLAARTRIISHVAETDTDTDTDRDTETKSSSSSDSELEKRWKAMLSAPKDSEAQKECESFLLRWVGGRTQGIGKFRQQLVSSINPSMKKRIQTMFDWNDDVDIEQKIQHYKAFLSFFEHTLPEMLQTGVNFTNIYMPKTWTFSSNHMKRLSGHIQEVYKEFNVFSTPRMRQYFTQKKKNRTPPPSSRGLFHYEHGVLPRIRLLLYEYVLLESLVAFLPGVGEKKVAFGMAPEDLEEDTTTPFGMAPEDLEDDEDEAEDKDENLPIAGVANRMLEQKEEVTKLLSRCVEVYSNQKKIVMYTPTLISETVFQLREEEKRGITETLKKMTHEERIMDRVQSKIGLGVYAKGQQKGLRVYDAHYYDDEQELRDTLLQKEKALSLKRHPDRIDEELEQEDRMQQEIDADVERMDYMNDDYWGNTNGDGGADELEEEDYSNYE
jgi:hypothetical protein